MRAERASFGTCTRASEASPAKSCRSTFAFVGKPGARNLLLLISGTHGVEGFCGSGCQVALLHDAAFLKAVELAKVEVLMLHALNPYGFSHLRRVNEDNADLNRNFVDFGSPLPVNTAYAEIHELLLPASWPPSAATEAKLAAWVAANGAKAYQAAVSGGQYQFPSGMFYGGKAPTWSNLVLRVVLREHAAKRERLGWIDFHTGLGPRGHGEKIYAGTDSAADIARTKSWWGADVTSFFDGSSTSAPLTGINGAAARDECPHDRVRGDCPRIRHVSDRPGAAGISRRALVAQSPGSTRGETQRNQMAPA